MYVPASEAIKPGRLREIKKLERRFAFEELRVGDDASARLEVEPSFRHVGDGVRVAWK